MTRCRWFAALAVLAGMMAGTSAIAGAQAQSNPWWVDRFPPTAAEEFGDVELRENGRLSVQYPLVRFYGLAEHELFVLTGQDLLSFCAGHTPQSQELITYRADGEFVQRTPAGGSEIVTYVYDSGPIDGLPWLLNACSAWQEDGTPPPSPLATGFTTLRMNSNPNLPIWTSGDQATGFFRNGVSGVVTDAAGSEWELRTFVSFPLTGEEQGPPAFVRHEVDLVPLAQ